MKQFLLNTWRQAATLFLFMSVCATGANATAYTETTVWEGSEQISWNTEVAPGTQFETPDGTFTGLEAGNIIRIYTTTTYDEPQYVVTYKKGDSWDWTDLDVTVADGVVSVTVADETTATEIAERGLILRGQAWTATKIVIAVAGEEEEPTPDQTSFILSTEETIAGNWAKAVQLSISDMADAKVAENDVLRVYVKDFTDADGEPSISLSYSDAEWSWKDFTTTYQYYNPATTTAYVDFAITGELLSVLQATNGENALLVRGKGYTTTKVELIKAEGYYVSLSDKSTALYLAGTADVQIERSLLAGFNTITLPFAATAKELTGSDDAYLAELSGVSTEDESTTLTFKKVETAVANKPYLIYVATAVDVQAQSGKEVAALVDDWNNQTWSGSFYMQGNYTPGKSVAGNYIVSGEDKIQLAGSSATLNGMRASIVDNSGSGVKGALTIAIEDSETGITTVLTPAQVSGLMFNLAGQRLSQPARGINIIGGRKVMVK